MRVGLISMVRNEQRLVGEFLAHHIGLGIERIHLFDNYSDDMTRPIIEQAAAAYPGITVESWDGTQIAAFQRGVDVLRDEVDWLFAGDCDEFIVSPDGNDLIDFLTFMGAHAAIGLNWALFGSSGLVADPEDLMTASFLRRAPDDYPINRHVKSFVRPRLVQGVWNPHTFALDEAHFPYVNCQAEGLHWDGRRGFAQNAPVMRPFRVNHYFCRDRAAWSAKVANSAHRAATDGDFTRTEEDWRNHDRNDVADTSALRYGPLTRQILANMGFHPPYATALRASAVNHAPAQPAQARPPEPSPNLVVIDAANSDPLVILPSRRGSW